MSDPLSHAIRAEQELEMLAKSDQELIVTAGHPVLVLAVSIPPPRGVFKRPLLHVYHQCGGIGCNSVDMMAIPLTPRPKALAAMQLIEQHWYDSSMGAIGTSLEDVLMYRTQLKTLLHPDADCNESYKSLQEAVYPIDLDMRVIREICEDDLPDNMDDLIEFESGMHRAFGVIGRWKCYILAENSD